MNSAPAIAITGLAFRLPGAENQDDFWKLLAEGTDQTAPVSQHRRDLASDQNWSDTVGELDDIQRFDAEFFGIEAEEAKFMDPQQRILMEVAHDAVCDAGLVEPHRPVDRRYAVYMALATNAYYPLVCQHMARHGQDSIHPRTIMNSINSAIAARVSHQYNFTGPVMSVDTACSSFLSALVEALEAIAYSQCDGAVVGGANILSSAFSSMLCNAGGITTPTGVTRVFDAEANGTLIGEGAVVVVLEREDIAHRKNRHVYGRILAHAINNDGASLNIMAPNPRGQARVIRDCYASGVDHTRVGYIEAHGTGTRIGDPIEINALGQVYRSEQFTDHKVGIGSVKSNFGHLLAAAGGAGLAKLLLCLHHGRMVPNLNLRTINPLLQLEETPFDVVTELRPWERIDGQPRVGAITSLGLGGTNVHLVVAEGTPPRQGTELKHPVLCLSAATSAALEERTAEARRLLTSGADPYNLAMTFSRFRPAHDWRAALRWNPSDPRDVRVTTAAPRTTVRKLLLRPTRETLAREDFFRQVFTGQVIVGAAAARRTDLAVVIGDRGEKDVLTLDPDLPDMEIATQLFLNGCLLDWEIFFPDGKGTLITLNPYPFAHTAHWITA